MIKWTLTILALLTVCLGSAQARDKPEIFPQLGHSVSVHSVALPPDGRWLASGSNDGTTRAWDISSGKEKVALIAFDDRSFLAITPEGCCDAASAAAEENLNVRVGTRVFGIGSYREKFYRPDLVKLRLAGNTPSGLGFAGISSVKAAPIVEFIDLPASTSESKLTVKLRLTDGGGGIGIVRLFLNGAVVVQEESLPASRGAAASGAGPVSRGYTVQLANGPNALRAVAFNADDSMSASTATATVIANLPVGPQGNLHAVVIGIQEFKNKKYNLSYSVADAQLIADSLRKYSTPLFQKVDIKLLTTPAETTRDSIIKTLKDMQSTVGPDDVFVFYTSSDGSFVDGAYYLVTSNVDSLDQLKDEAVSTLDLNRLLANIPATRKLVILDTSHAQAFGDALHTAPLSRGMSDGTAAVILSRAIGLTVLAATTTDEEALDGYEGHGLFTYIVAQGLAGKGDVDKNGVVTTMDLAHYVMSQLPPLALNLYRHEQQPTVDMSGQYFPITKVK